MPDPAVLPRARIFGDEIAKELVASVGQNAVLRIQGPFQIPAELIDVVDVAGESAPLQLRDSAHRKPLGIDPRGVFGVRVRPGDRHNGYDCGETRNPDRRKEQRE